MNSLDRFRIFEGEVQSRSLCILGSGGRSGVVLACAGVVLAGLVLEKSINLAVGTSN